MLPIRGGENWPNESLEPYAAYIIAKIMEYVFRYINLALGP